MTNRIRHVLYLSRRMAQDPNGDQMAVYIYDFVWEAKRSLGIMLETDDIIWEHDNKLRSESGIVVEIHPCKDTKYTLRMLWEHEDTVAQMGRTLSVNLRDEARRFRHRRQPSEVAPKVEKVRTGLTRAPRDGMVPVGDIAAAFGVTAREVRGALRKARVPKPSQGWAWKPADVEGVKKLVGEALGK